MTPLPPVEQVRPGLWSIPVPLPMNSLRYVLVYAFETDRGRQVRGVVSAGNEVDLYKQLQSAGLELVQCAPLSEKSGHSMFQKKVKIRDLIQLFIHMEQMQSAGVPMLEALADIRDTTDHNRLRDIMTEVHRAVSEGSAGESALPATVSPFAKATVPVRTNGYNVSA